MKTVWYLTTLFLMLFIAVSCSDNAKQPVADEDSVEDTGNTTEDIDATDTGNSVDDADTGNTGSDFDSANTGNSVTDDDVVDTGDSVDDSDDDGGDTVIPQCTDIMCDGYPDIVFANTDEGTNTNINSYIYLGSKDGYSIDNRIEIPTIGAMGVDYADVNKDGYIDIAFAAVKEIVDGEETRFTTSLLYYGTKDGFDLANPVKFNTMGCADITLADVDLDGWIDVLTPNRFKGNKEDMNNDDYKIPSYIFWGGPAGFDTEHPLELPTVGAAKARVADFNKDGNMDILFPSGVQEMVGVFDSYIYWGDGNGRIGWPTRTELPSVSPETATVQDINEDGWLDIYISGWLCLIQCKLKNRIYWGSATGFDEDRFTQIETDGITEAIFKDLNGDGNTDIVLADGSVTNLLTQEFAKESHIFWGTPSGNADKYTWSDGNSLDLPAVAASEAGVEDLNGDGFDDIVFASHYAAKDGDPEVSQIYWGSKDGYSADNVTLLPTQHAAGMKIIGTYNPK